MSSNVVRKLGIVRRSSITGYDFEVRATPTTEDIEHSVLGTEIDENDLAERSELDLEEQPDQKQISQADSSSSSAQTEAPETVLVQCPTCGCKLMVGATRGMKITVFCPKCSKCGVFEIPVDLTSTGKVSGLKPDKPKPK